MAVHGRYTRILLDEFDFSGVNNTAEVSVSSDSADVTTFQASAKEYVTLSAEGTITHQGYYTSAEDGYMEAELQRRMATTTSIAAALFGTSADSYPAYVLTDTGTKDMTLNGSTGSVITLNGGYHGGSGIKRGIVLYSGTVSATGASTYVDMGSAGSNGGYVYLFVQTITGTASSATVKFQSASSSGGSYADEATITFSAVGASAGAMTGTVERYMKINTTSLGGATSFDIVAVACVNGVTM